MTDIGNSHQQPPAGPAPFLGAQIHGHAEDGVVEIARVFAVDGDEGDIAQIDPPLDFRRAYGFGQARRAFERGFGKLMRHAEFTYGDFDAGIVDLAQHLDDAPQRLGVAGGLLQNLHGNHLAMFRTIDLLGRNQDIVLDALIFGHHDAGATLAQEAADELVGTALEHFDDKAFQLAAIFAFDLGQNSVAMQHLEHFARREKEIGPAIVAQQKTESVAVPLHTARQEFKLGIDLNLALPVDENLAVAFHGLEPPFKPDGKWHGGAD